MLRLVLLVNAGRSQQDHPSHAAICGPATGIAEGIADEDRQLLSPVPRAVTKNNYHTFYGTAIQSPCCHNWSLQRKKQRKK